MLTKSNYNFLQQVGLDIWQPRIDKHPLLTAGLNNTTQIIPAQIRINARCLILQYHALHPYTPSAAETKIACGMIGVLELQHKDVMHAWVYAHNPDVALVIDQIDQWQPKYILQLSMELPALGRQNCVQTYSAAYLLQHPQDKAQAYKSLLNLRAMLHDTSTPNP